MKPLDSVNHFTAAQNSSLMPLKIHSTIAIALLEFNLKATSVKRSIIYIKLKDIYEDNELFR